jgi:hypothetical protein
MSGSGFGDYLTQIAAERDDLRLVGLTDLYG